MDMACNKKWGPLVGLPFFDYRGFVYFALRKWGLATAWTTVVATFAAWTMTITAFAAWATVALWAWTAFLLFFYVAFRFFLERTHTEAELAGLLVNFDEFHLHFVAFLQGA